MTSPAEHAPVAEPTGTTGPTGSSDAADPIAAALRSLDAVGGLPLDQRPDVFTEIHRRLDSALAEIDDA